MTNQQHPMTPPPELVQQWNREGLYQDYYTLREYIAARAAEWGADSELEACIADIHTMYGKDRAAWLRSMRRPNQPTLKEQALAALKDLDLSLEDGYNASTIRRALEELPE